MIQNLMPVKNKEFKMLSPVYTPSEPWALVKPYDYPVSRHKCLITTVTSLENNSPLKKLNQELAEFLGK